MIGSLHISVLDTMSAHEIRALVPDMQVTVVIGHNYSE